MISTYRVTQTLVKIRVVEVAAASAKEARALARAGHGEIVEGRYARFRLLADAAERQPRRVRVSR